MKLSKLIEMAENELKSKGDVDVVAVVSWDEECDKCCNTQSHVRSGKVYKAHIRDGIYTGNGSIRPYFFIVASN